MDPVSYVCMIIFLSWGVYIWKEKKCGILEKCDEMCQLCAAPAIYLLLGATQLSEKETTQKYICGQWGKV